ncbi:hypothetical protein M0812_10760 [Anaeramoeba flamelloides]|uniref:Uncharacterized protein n=1 Tax=Anaeramoeba flamelloides TaxID=1746091 RepID=A0AAV7ZTI5_9EUKA|nr:hypothetical protein M0812_10760 [Anaeramoeba flamelloides]
MTFNLYTLKVLSNLSGRMTTTSSRSLTRSDQSQLMKTNRSLKVYPFHNSCQRISNVLEQREHSDQNIRNIKKYKRGKKWISQKPRNTSQQNKVGCQMFLGFGENGECVLSGEENGDANGCGYPDIQPILLHQQSFNL